MTCDNCTYTSDPKHGTACNTCREWICRDCINSYGVCRACVWKEDQHDMSCV